MSSGAAKPGDEDSGWNNTGTYIGVGGLAVAAILFYMRSVRPMMALIIAAIAVGAGWYMQPEKKKVS